jgi:uncharacterized membrane protein
MFARMRIMATRSAALQAFLIGTASGLRSMTGPAMLANAAKPGDFHLPGGSWEFLESTTTARALAVCAAGELIADKLPFMPARIAPPALLARAALGAACGAALYSKDRRPAISPAIQGALLGLGGALAASFAGYYLRRAATQRGVPDLAAALVEDGVALGTAVAVTRRLRALQN